jgi:putative transposase
MLEQCLRPVDEAEGSYLPDHLEALKQGRRANAGREGTTRAQVVPGAGDGGDDSHGADSGGTSLIDEIVRDGARRMLAAALQAEVEEYIAAFATERDEAGRRLVVRNGSHQPREVLTAAGAVEVVAPRVDDRRTDPETGERRRFSSAILPPWCRRTPKITEVLPLLYLHGLSSGDFVPALGQFLGSTAGLSPAVITKLTETWQSEARAFAGRDPGELDFVYCWADGIHVNVRLEEAKLCLLVLVGVRADGRKELIALADGYRESGESWADLLRDCARRGMRAPVLAVGDGALGFWGALREVFPATREQRCWVHRSRQELTRRRVGQELGSGAVPDHGLGREVAVVLE